MPPVCGRPNRYGSPVNHHTKILIPYIIMHCCRWTEITFSRTHLYNYCLMYVFETLNTFFNYIKTGLELSEGWTTQFMSTDAHFWVKNGFKFQSMGKISNISATDPPPVLLGQFQHCVKSLINCSMEPGNGKHGRKWRRPTGVQGRSHTGQSVSAEAYDWQARYNNWHAELYERVPYVCARRWNWTCDIEPDVGHCVRGVEYIVCGIRCVLVIYWLNCQLSSRNKPWVHYIHAYA